ncbi:MAG: hypothetical protein KatS3mg115_2417 [Candidatus Poribacteria bacterium]|nr:MAG: hypothetical protein KatS3mg115_2417 [Candidatus Poribacteria bacterium]
MGRLRHVDWRRLLLLLAGGVLIGLVWNQSYFKPIRLFVVLLHELSHAFAARATGGGVAEVQLFLNEGGLTRTYGGSPFWILNAGYLGSLFWGGLLLLGAGRYGVARSLAIGMGVLLLGVTVLYVRSGVGILVGWGFGGFLLLAGALFRREVVAWSVGLIGLSSCLYAVYDILSDVLLRPEAPSDARMLAERVAFPPLLSPTGRTIFWGGLWTAISLAFSLWVLGRSVSRR